MGRAKKTDKCSVGKVDCVSFGVYGKCRACIETDFSTGECPFYKTERENREQNVRSLERLQSLNRYDLISKYGELNEARREWDMWGDLTVE